MKRTIFTLIMLALPAGVLAIGFVVYVKMFGENNPMIRFVTDYIGTAKPVTPYEANWAEVVVIVPVPYVGGNYRPNIRGAYVNTNDLGYRGVIDHEQILEESRRLKAAGFKIVVFTGGSAAFGAFSDNDDTTITAFLNRFLVQIGRRVKVFNFAMGSYTSDDELASLVMYAADTRPDLLVVMDGYNDAVRGARGSHAMGVGIPYAYATIRKVYPAPFQSSFLDRTYEVGSSKALEAIQKRYERNLKGMKSYMTGSGGEILFATQPMKGYHSNTAKCQQAREDFQDREGLEDKQRVTDIVFRQYPALIQTGRDVGGIDGYVHLADAFSHFPDACPFFVDRMHMSSAGQEVVARGLLPHILHRLSLPPLTDREMRLLQY
ncbi:MAG TPA: SGNH/GDSL hydrolase family protein [Nitrospira sp.]|nr:SGNH/GDSL hydrolase family protein [Nitrospira sp.]